MAIGLLVTEDTEDEELEPAAVAEARELLIDEDEGETSVDIPDFSESHGVIWMHTGKLVLILYFTEIVPQKMLERTRSCHEKVQVTPPCWYRD